MPQEKLDPIRNIGKRVEEKGKDLGLSLRNFYAIPSMDGESPDRCMIVFEYDPENTAMPQISLGQADASMRESMDKIEKERLAKRAEEARRDLRDLGGKLKNPRKGFLDD